MKYFEMKKRAFMSIVNAVKGFIRKVSGTPPITLPDCVDDDSLISYSLGLEDTRVNLYKSIETSYNGNGITITRNADGTYTVNGTATNTVYFHIGDMLVDTTKMYYLSGGTENAYLAVRQMCNGVSQNSIISKGNGSLNIPTSYYHITIDTFNPIIYIPSGNICDNEIIKPMISHIATDDYVPYVEPETLGDKTKNLLDITKYKTQNNPKFTLENGVLDLTYYTWTHHLYYEIKGLKPSTNYTFSMLANKQAQMYYNDVIWFAATTKTADGYYTCAQTIKSSSTGTMKIAFKYGTDNTGFSCKAWNLQLEEGTTATEYEPFGYKIPITMSGKNLFDKSKYSYTVGWYNVDGVFQNSANGATGHTNNYSRVKPNTEYHCSSLGGYITATLGVYFYNEEKEWLGRQSFTVISSTLKNGYTFTTPENCCYVRFQIPVLAINDIIVFDAETFQLEKGNVLTDYEPFINPITTNIILDEPLIAGNVLEYPKDNIPKLPTVKGTTIYSVETEVQPSNMSVEYYATRKGE